MYYIAILFEHIDFLNRLDRLDIQLLQRGLQLLVIGAGGFVDFLRLSAGGAFASTCLSVQSSKLGKIVGVRVEIRTLEPVSIVAA